jgi:hypothetical protein
MPDSNWPQFLEFTRKIIQASKKVPEEELIITTNDEKPVQPPKKEKPDRKKSAKDLAMVKKELVETIEEKPGESFYIVGEEKLNGIISALDKLNSRLHTMSHEHEELKKKIRAMEEKLRLNYQMNELKKKMSVLKKEIMPAKKKKK